MSWNVPTPLAIACLALFLLTACGDSDDPQDPGNQNHGDDPPASAEAPGELMQSDVDQDTDPDVDDAVFAEFSADNRDFAFSIFDQLRQEEGEGENIFTSPHSISLALAMTYAAAEENTRDEMAQALRFLIDDDDLHPAFNLLGNELDSRSDLDLDEDEGEAFELDVVNQTWGQDGAPFAQDYLDLLALNYGAGMYGVNFAEDPEEIREGINKWVEAQTNQRIEDLLPEGSITPATIMVLVNAIYFYGSWNAPFDEELTESADFTRPDNSTTSVEMMDHFSTVAAGYYEDDDTVAVSIPYVGRDLSMIALKPADEDDDFYAWEEALSREDFDAIVDEMSVSQGSLQFPKFEDEGEFGLVDAFQALGMNDAFEPSAANFMGFYDDMDLPSPVISGIFHKTFVAVDEEGTEAAAATAVVAEDTSAPVEQWSARFDRAFSYAIYDHPTETILFMGRLVDPS